MIIKISIKMRFAANLSTLCSDIPKLTDRFVHLMTRKDYSFKWVECQNPYSVPVAEWQALMKQHSPVSWVLINSPHLFDVWTDSSRFPTREEYKNLVLDKVIEYATGLECKKVHLVMTDVQDDSQLPVIEDLLSYGIQVLRPLGITCLLEPLATRPRYYLRSYEKAVQLATDPAMQEGAKVMLDTFHLQMLHGNLTANIDKLLPNTGHVQVSQAPLRNSPFAAGEINYAYFLKRLSSYDGVIGLEYSSSSSESFSWLQDFDSL